MANNCSKLMKEALDSFLGIEYRYKMNDLLDSMPSNQKFSSEQLKGYMLKQGVSPKEIEASNIFKGFENDNRALTIQEWKDINPSKQEFSKREQTQSYEDITLGNKGVDNPTYKVNEFTTKDKVNGNTNLRHQMGPDEGYDETTQLGWNRVHQDTINGKPTTVLNELQSDWMQAERQGAGTFESNTIDILHNPDYIGFNPFPNAYASLVKYINTSAVPRNSELYTSLRSVMNNEHGQKMIDVQKLSNILGEAKTLELLKLDAIKDFPMKPEKFQQLMIVDGINEAISNGTKRVAIPIQRENELIGGSGVTKFYEGLNKKILPEIRSKLEKQGLRIKLSQEDYNTGDYQNKLHILTIEEVPNAKVKWDVYGLLASIGLGAYASKSEANTNIDSNSLAPREMAIETEKKQKAITEKAFSLKDLNVQWPEKVNPSSYKDNNKGIKDYIAKIESRGYDNPYIAKNSKSGAEGKYQILPSNYQELSDALGIPIRDLRKPENQEKVMDYLVGEYKATLEKWNLPVTKENMFVLHNLGQTGGVRVLRGTYQPSDIKNMAGQLASNMDKSSRNAIITNYATMYNVDIPKQRRA